MLKVRQMYLYQCFSTGVPQHTSVLSNSFMVCRQVEYDQLLCCGNCDFFVILVLLSHFGMLPIFFTKLVCRKLKKGRELLPYTKRTLLVHFVNAQEVNIRIIDFKDFTSVFTNRGAAAHKSAVKRCHGCRQILNLQCFIDVYK
jgi:hypothetical protein